MAGCLLFPKSGTKTGLILTVTVMLFSAWPQSSLPFVDAVEGKSLPKLILISLDGFGWHFLSKVPKSKLPNIQTVIEKGVHVRWVENVFPTKTLPNHMSMVSGLYPESHGIVNNKFFDPVFNTSKPASNVSDYSKWIDMGAEPIWVTNSKAGNGRRSGSVYWPSSEAKIKGWMPDEIKKEKKAGDQEDVSYNERIDIALEWLTSESSDRVNFAAVYTHGVDEISHKYGPDSQEMVNQIVFCDATIGHLLSSIKEKKLEDELNVIITADHGHSAIYPELMVNIDELLDPSWYHSYPNLNTGSRLMVNLWPKEGFYHKVVDALKGDHLNLHVAIKGESEELVALHYSANRRIAPVVLYAEPGWVIGRTNATFKSGKGEHGWDPRFDPFMYPFFLAMGPAFKTGVRNAKPFHIVDMYSMMCHILGLNPAPNNGSLANTVHILARPPSDSGTTTTESSINYAGVIIGLVVLLIGVVIVAVVVLKVRQTHNVSAAYRRTFAKAGSAEDLLEDGEVVLSDEEL